MMNCLTNAWHLPGRFAFLVICSVGVVGISCLNQATAQDGPGDLPSDSVEGGNQPTWNSGLEGEGGGNGRPGPGIAGKGLVDALSKISRANSEKRAAIDLAQKKLRSERSKSGQQKKDQQDLKKPPQPAEEARDTFAKKLKDRDTETIFGGSKEAYKNREADAEAFFSEERRSVVRRCVSPLIIDKDPIVIERHRNRHPNDVPGPGGKICCVPEAMKLTRYKDILPASKEFLTDEWVVTNEIETGRSDHLLTYRPDEVQALRKKRLEVMLANGGASARESHELAKKAAEKLGAPAPQTAPNAGEIDKNAAKLAEKLKDVNRDVAGMTALEGGAMRYVSSIRPAAILTEGIWKKRYVEELFPDDKFHEDQFSKNPAIVATIDQVKSFNGDQYRYMMRPELIKQLENKETKTNLAEGYAKYEENVLRGFAASSGQRNDEALDRVLGQGERDPYYFFGYQFPGLVPFKGAPAPYGSQNMILLALQIAHTAYAEEQREQPNKEKRRWFPPEVLAPGPKWTRRGVPAHGVSMEDAHVGRDAGARFLWWAAENDPNACMGGTQSELEDKVKKPIGFGEHYGDDSNIVEEGKKANSFMYLLVPMRACPVGYVIHPESGCGLEGMEEWLSQDKRTPPIDGDDPTEG